RVTARAEGVWRAMFLTRLKIVAALVLTLPLGTGAGVFAYQALVTGQPEERGRQQAARPRTDRYGDPLPAGAVLRLGTVHLRHDDAVSGVAVAPDGNLLASAGLHGTARPWPPPRGRHPSPP